MVFWSAEERLRREAARWFGRMRGSNAFRHNRRFKAWLDQDPRHRAAYERLVSRWDAAYLLKGSETVEQYLAPPPSRFGAPLWLAPALAAAVLVALALGLALLVSGYALPRGPVLASAIGQRKSLVLADGSRLTLDADSAVSAQHNPRAARLLRGRARFAIAAETTPFVVQAGDMVMSAQDAEFDVERLGADRVDIVLNQGAIDIAPRGPFGFATSQRWIHLTGRTRASLHGTGMTVGPVAPPAPGSDWTSGPLSFDQTPVGEALVAANRYSPRKIRLASPDLGRLQVTGVFDVGASNDLAEGLARALGLSLAVAPNGDWVLSRRAA